MRRPHAEVGEAAVHHERRRAAFGEVAAAHQVVGRIAAGGGDGHDHFHDRAVVAGGGADLQAALAQHPNAGGVLILGLGCESNQLDALLGDIPDRSRIRAFTTQGEDDEFEAGLAAIADLVAIAEQDHRVPCPLSDLVVGLKCGGSDGFSGLTANPLVGHVADTLAAAGGTPGLCRRSARRTAGCLGFPPAAIRLLLDAREGIPVPIISGLTLVIAPELIGSGGDVSGIAAKVAAKRGWKETSMLLVDPLAAFFRPALEGCAPLTIDCTFVEVTLLPPLVRIDTLDELDYYRNGGILPYV
eukprot:gene10379-13951_t